MRFQQLMPDVLNWLGVKHIDILVSMSNMKYDAIVSQGITVGERLAIPDEQIPDDAKVEMEAKKPQATSLTPHWILMLSKARWAEIWS